MFAIAGRPAAESTSRPERLENNPFESGLNHSLARLSINSGPYLMPVFICNLTDSWRTAIISYLIIRFLTFIKELCSVEAATGNQL